MSAISNKKYNNIRKILNDKDNTFLTNYISNLKNGLDGNGWHKILIIVGNPSIRKELVKYITSSLKTKKHDIYNDGLVEYYIQLIHITNNNIDIGKDDDLDEVYLNLKSLNRCKGLGILMEMKETPKIPIGLDGSVYCIKVEAKPEHVINTGDLGIFNEWLNKLQRNKTMRIKFLIVVGGGCSGKTTLIRTVSDNIKTERRRINSICNFKDDTKLIWFTEDFKEWTPKIISQIVDFSEYNIGMIMGLQKEPIIPSELYDFTRIIHTDGNFKEELSDSDSD